MEKIIISVVIVGLFIFFVYFLVNLYKNEKIKKEENLSEKKPEKVDESGKEEMPAILKEITMGNYMHDMSKSNDGEVEMEEDMSIQIPEIDNIRKVEKAFDDINDINVDVDLEVDEIDDIDNELMGDLDNVPDDELESNGKSIADEYKGLSKNMKALIIANFLEKKNK